MWETKSLGHNAASRHYHLFHSVPLRVPVQFTDGSQPANVAPAAGQDGQMVGVQREEEALGGELGLRELGRVFICPVEPDFIHYLEES